MKDRNPKELRRRNQFLRRRLNMRYRRTGMIMRVIDKVFIYWFNY
jgi:hypothetical protein